VPSAPVETQLAPGRIPRSIHMAEIHALTAKFGQPEKVTLHDQREVEGGRLI
jgi:hypothetical protein